MMATFVISLAVNRGSVKLLAKHRGCPTADLEESRADVVRHHDAVVVPVTSSAYIDGARVRWEP